MSDRLSRSSLSWGLCTARSAYMETHQGVRMGNIEQAVRKKWCGELTVKRNTGTVSFVSDLGGDPGRLPCRQHGRKKRKPWIWRSSLARNR
jgi:hypothetical protein